MAPRAAGSVDTASWRPLTAPPSTVGEFNGGGAASTAFWVDPAEELTVILMARLLPTGALPVRTMLRQTVYRAVLV